MSEISIIWPGGGQGFATSRTGSVLDAALAAQIPVPHSCMRSDCLSCSALVAQSDEGSLAVGSLVQLCQVPAASPGVFELADDPRIGVIESKLRPARLLDVCAVANDVYRVAFALPPGECIPFKGGQYASIILGTGLARSYSIATSAPGRIEFFVKHVAGGKFGDWLTRTAKPREMVRIRAPFGSFFYRPRPARRTLLVATGTGIVPIYAMLQQTDTAILHDAGDIELLWGNRRLADIFLERELAQLCDERHVTLQRFFSQEPDEAKRRVTDAATKIDCRDATVYSSGNPEMISEIRQICLNNHLDPRRFYSDAFVYSEAQQKPSTI